MSELPTRSVYNHTLTVGGITMPVRVFKGTEAFGLESHMYHDDCGGKIRSPYVCEDHPNDPAPTIVTKIETINGTIPIDPIVKNSLLQRGSTLVTEGILTLSQLWAYISTGEYVVGDFYTVTTGPAPLGFSDETLSAVLNRLRVRKKALLCSASLAGGMKRYYVLLPGGKMYGLFYNEEIRAAHEIPSGPTSRSLNRVLDDLLDDLPEAPAGLSMKPIQQRVFRWINEQLLAASSKKKSRGNPKKKIAQKESANA
jgi:hypothetical protein